MNLSLADLGWNDQFEAHFFEYKETGMVPGRIFMEQKSEYVVVCEKGEFIAKIAGKIRHQAASKSDLPVVGDWVVMRILDNGSALVEAILPRKTQISRLAAGSRKRQNTMTNEEQVIGANLDTIFIVTGLDQDYNIRRIERYLTMVYNSGAKPVIILNKSDLCSDLEAVISDVEAIAFGVPLHTISAKEMAELTELNDYVKPGKTVALLGSSGVGKSTIINNLLGNDRQKVKEISDSVGKGQHTTTHREIFILPEGGLIMDNPGMREIVLSAEQENLLDAFADIERFASDCKFNDCNHHKEPGCAVKQAVERGDINQERLDSYHKMQRELKYLNDRKKMGANKADKEKWTKLFKEENNKTR